MPYFLQTILFFGEVFAVFPDTADILKSGGLGILLLLVYAETAFFIGLVLPGGESLVFAAGLLAGTGFFTIPLYLMIPLLILAAAAGDITGYFIGKKYGRKLFYQSETWVFKKENLALAKKFYSKHGKLTIILGKFIPVIRPMVPPMSGAVEMPAHQFIMLSLLSSTIWINVFALSSYFLGQKFPQLKDYIIYIIPITIIIALIPLLRKFWKRGA